MRNGLILAMIPLLLNCGGNEDDKPTLDVVANQITFKSVENLGAHHMLATIRQETAWPDETEEVHEETVELAWNNWDNFHLRRVVRGATVAETIVDQGQSYRRSQGPRWLSEIDVEPARMRVRTSWKVWDSAMDVLAGRVLLTPGEQSIVDGRSAKQFKVSLKPIEPGVRIKSGAMVPQSIEGEVWLDETTAVRLSADVVAVVEQKGMKRTITLNLRRGKIGQEQTITPPETSVSTPADVLRERNRGRRTPSGRVRPKPRNP